MAYLLDHGLDVNGRAEVSGHPPMLHLAVGKAIPRSVKAIMIERVADVDVRRKDGKTALHLAAADGDLEAVSLLLARGANPTLEDNNRNTPLSVAAPDVKLMLQAR